jgi:hypothetical protein
MNMSMTRKIVIATAVVAGLAASVPVALTQNALAQPAAGPGAAAPGTGQHAARPERPSRIEGRLAFLKTELKITDGQTQQWEALASVMRQQDQAMRAQMQQMREQRQQRGDKPMNAVERFEQRERMSTARLERSKQFLVAFRPLYEKLSDEQKKTADDLFARVHRGGRGGPHHHRL